MASRSRSVSRPRRVAYSVRAQGIHRFSRSTDPVTESIYGVYLSRQYSHKFNDPVAHGEFNNLFETYRIDKIIMIFQLISNPDAYAVTKVATAGNPSNWFPKTW